MLARIILALLLAISPQLALAQAAQCDASRQTARPEPEGPSKAEPKRVLPIGTYTLALTWSPQYCSTARGRARDFQCDGRGGRFGFTLHGLWPDGVGREWPQYCRAADLLPREIIRQNLCTTPSVQLLQHEWAKHGTCMATQPKLYFDLSRTFYQSLRFPDMTALARRPTLTVGAFVQAFARLNRGIRPDMVRIRTTRGNWLEEMWICLDRVMEYSRCPTHQTGANDKSLLRIEAGPALAYATPAMPRPAGAPPAARPGARPAPAPVRKPKLLLDLDPKVQPLTKDAPVKP